MEKPLQISKRTLIILLCTMIAAILVGLALLLWMLLDGLDDGKILLPDDAYQTVDPNVQPYPGGKDDPALQYPAGGGAASFICEAQLQIDLGQARVGLMFANPANSPQNMLIELRIQDVTVAQSGRIEPGYRITEMTLQRGDVLTQGIYRGELLIYFYAPDTGVQTVQTSFPVSVTVKQGN